jgi:hypothetical protein
MGPYAMFYCDRCEREYRSTPSITATVTENVTRGALGGFLRNIPVIGGAAADQVENDRDRTNLSPDELAAAWGQVSQYFRECPTCHEILCVPDFDEPSGFCDQCTPRGAEIEAAKAQQAAAAWKGVADVFGITGAIQQGIAAAAANAPAQAAATAAAAPCGSCGAGLAAGAKFCASCGTPVPQASACASCSAPLTPGARFCASCGTAAAA